MNRIAARNRPLTLLITLLVALPAVAHAADSPARKPNIILIYSDDHGWADLGIQGVDKDIRTPHLDQLAQDGVRFTRGYVSAPQCVPSRCGVITGRYQQRFGVEDNGRGPLPLSEQTIAERLQPAGYLGGWVGKSHLDVGGEKGASKGSRILPEHMPHRQGFAEYFRGELRQYYASHDLEGHPFADAPHLVKDDRFRVDVQTEAALSFLDRRASTPEQPWFLSLAWYAPHVPLESPEPWFSKTPAQLPLKRRQALAMIAAMDDGLGQIRAKLREMGEERDTLIFFIGDNGAPLGDAWDGSVNLPMVGQKGMLAEGGIRVPFVAAWPGRWPAGVTYDKPVINLDVAATAAAAAGLPHDARLDGVNLTPFVTGQDTSAPHDALYWRWGSQAAVLEMPYKLIRLGGRPPLLFDLTEPEGENMERNLAAEQPETVARLERRLRGWAATLQPPGLSEDASAFSRRHEQLFAEHRITPETPAARRRAEPGGGPVQAEPAAASMAAEHPQAILPLEVSANQRYLVTSDGRPFFWLGDTAWELFHRLNREEAERYLEHRARQGFTVIQAVVLAEIDGLGTPNAYGHTPLHDKDPTRPNEDYFRHVDWVIAKANSLGLRIGLLPTWGSYWHSKKVIFTPHNAEIYGRWLGERYRDAGIVWILGGDRLVESDRHRGILDAMARALAAGDGGAHLRTFHPRGGGRSSEPFHQAPWLDFNMLQSGHSPQSTNYAAIELDYALTPPKPCLDAEPAYEYPPDAMPEKRPVGAAQVRRNAYWAVFAGAFGHTYGTHPVWQMYASPRTPLWEVVTPWHDALDLPGARQMAHLKALMLSRPFLSRVPDQTLIVDGQAEGLGRIQVTRDGSAAGNDATYLMAYFPAHRQVTVRTEAIRGSELRAWWFNPRTGAALAPEVLPNAQQMSFTPPTNGADEDWVLVLDDAAKNYDAPGKAAWVSP